MDTPNMTEIAEVGAREKLDAQGVLDLIKAHEINERVPPLLTESPSQAADLRALASLHL